MKKMRCVVLTVLVLALLAGIGAVFLWEMRKEAAVSAPETEETAAAASETEETRVTEPEKKLREVETILVMGLDKYQAEEESMGYLNDQQSDFLMLLILDRQQQTCDLLHLNRDTMTKIQRLGVGGGSAGSFEGQLALAHTFGSGKSDSCINAVKAVSNLLGDIRIDHYVTMTMETMGILNDLVGGVTVELMDDFTYVDPSFEQGKTVTLQGDEALTYVRARGELEEKTNLHRMERQRQYLEALFSRFQICIREDPDFVSTALRKVFPYLYSDCSLQQLSKLGENVEHYTIHSIESIPGEAVQGEKFIEFYPDEEGLQAVIDKLFYE